ncbi:hypothetical protein JKF63_04418 [Porcisia hertigi]|uniref:Uncharacterized protein n=1 Tax=Porcisia hertigi TaxID=2761500 RepID=A0A836ISD6_9TRYP|nr:hypothetical protein JKF63_04418 [Porcisia hertigi]
MDPYYYLLAFMSTFMAIVLFLLTRSAGRIAKERKAEAAASSSAEGGSVAMGSTRARRARREE